MHNFGKLNSILLNIFNIEVGSAIDFNYFLDNDFTIEELEEMGVLDNVLYDLFDMQEMLKEEFNLDVMDFIMNDLYDLMHLEQDLILYVIEMYMDIHDINKNFVLTYLEEFNKVRVKAILNSMQELICKEKILDELDVEYDEIKDISKIFFNAYDAELYKIELEELPIYDILTNSFIQENIERLKEENFDLLVIKLNNLYDQFDKDNSIMLRLKHNTQIYKKQLEYSHK
jgi:hypothetical protein